MLFDLSHVGWLTSGPCQVLECTSGRVSSLVECPLCSCQHSTYRSAAAEQMQNTGKSQEVVATVWLLLRSSSKARMSQRIPPMRDFALRASKPSQRKRNPQLLRAIATHRTPHCTGWRDAEDRWAWSQLLLYRFGSASDDSRHSSLCC